MTAEDTSLLREAVSVLVPPCGEEPVAVDEPGWQIDVSAGMGARGELSEVGCPVLAWPDSGMRLTIVDAADGVTLAARYRADSPVALVEVDVLRRRTRVRIPDGDPPSRRWADWVARAFFGTRLLADGWLLIHAAAVRMTAGGGDRALLVLAGQQGGKSTLAHRACAELGAQLLADDLEMALSLWRKAGDLSGEATTLNEFGNIYCRLGRPDEALDHHHQALTLVRQAGSQYIEAQILNDLGATCAASGHTGQAAAHHREALALATQTHNPYEQASAHNGIAHALYRTDPDSAQRHQDQALAIITDLGVPEAHLLHPALTNSEPST
jgi:hypothetical protein